MLICTSKKKRLSLTYLSSIPCSIVDIHFGGPGNFLPTQCLFTGKAYHSVSKNLCESYGKFTIPKLANEKCSLKSTVMNNTIKGSSKKQDAEKGPFKVRHVISSVSNVTYHDSVKDNAKFTKVMCRYKTANKDIMATNSKFM